MNTPNHRSLALALILSFTLVPSTVLAAAPFVRAGVQYFSYTASDYSGEAGGSVALGRPWGAAEEHEWSLEVARAAWSGARPLGLAAGLGQSAQGHQLPVLANYRHYFGAADARVRGYAGLSAGLVQTSGDAQFLGSGLSYGGPVDETAAIFGATVGLRGQLGATVAYDLGYRYLQAGDLAVATRLLAGAGGFSGAAGPAINLPGLSAHVVALSLTVRF